MAVTRADHAGIETCIEAGIEATAERIPQNAYRSLSQSQLGGGCRGEPTKQRTACVARAWMRGG
jgi:hypothetical protein